MPTQVIQVNHFGRQMSAIVGSSQNCAPNLLNYHMGQNITSTTLNTHVQHHLQQVAPQHVQQTFLVAPPQSPQSQQASQFIMQHQSYGKNNGNQGQTPR